MTADVAAFQTERPRLRALAYRMLGAAADADDVVQEAWLRYSLASTPIARPEAWLTTVVTRLAVDRLRSAQVRREAYVGPWLPEPIAEDAPASSPEHAVIMAESLSLGFLTVLERLSPLERAVFLLHDVFDVPLVEVAQMIERAVPATRQLAKRARDHVRAGRPRFSPHPDDVEALSDAFLAAAMSGDLALLGSMLTDDVMHLSDGGAEHRAARAPIVGRARVARFIANLAARTPEGGELHKVRANGEFAYYLTVHGEPYLLLVANWVDAKMTCSLAIRNPDKLASFHAAWKAGNPHPQ
jgi:RNA polymerase sigma-70 factor (ECF subfamily)